MNNRMMLIYLWLEAMFAFTFAFGTYAYISKKVDFRFEYENRSSVYLYKDSHVILDGQPDKYENLMYCENVIKQHNGINCGFYLNGKLFNIGKSE